MSTYNKDIIIIKCNLFTSSMDDLSVALNNSGIGGYLGDAFLIKSFMLC